MWKHHHHPQSQRQKLSKHHHRHNNNNNSKKWKLKSCFLFSASSSSSSLLLVATLLFLLHLQKQVFQLSVHHQVFDDEHHEDLKTTLSSSSSFWNASRRTIRTSNLDRQQQQQQQQQSTTTTIAYAISVTSCQVNSTNVLDGAAILGHSIHLASQRSVFDYTLYAFLYRPDANACIPYLQALGWNVQVHDTLPIQVDNIQDPGLKEWVDKKGCCGVKEFMKLFVYTLDQQHAIAVHFDTDALLLQPMDDLFHTMLNYNNNTSFLPDHHVMGSVPHRYRTNEPPADFYFTRDYNQGTSTSTIMNSDKNTTTEDSLSSQYGVQGGFFVVRPNRSVYEELVYRLENVETYHPIRGWSNKGHTGFWGASQIQGYLSYVYKHIYPGRGVELNRCIYNSMINDSPFHKKTGQCLTKTCEDCRTTDFNSIISIHLTTCNKPWACPKLQEPVYPSLCQKAHRAWFQVRQQLEQQLERRENWPNNLSNNNNITEGWHFEYTLGYCQRPKAWAKLMGLSNNNPTGIKIVNKRQYVPLRLPSSTIESTS